MIPIKDVSTLVPVYDKSIEMINDDLKSILFVCAVISYPLSFVEIESNGIISKREKISGGSIDRPVEYHWVEIQVQKLKYISISCSAINQGGNMRSNLIINLSMSFKVILRY